MTANISPTIITSKLFLGVVPSTQLGNVAWSDDGQCLFLTKRGVTVMVNSLSLHSDWADRQTPWLVSSMPPPPTLIDPNMISDKSGKEEGEEEDEAMDGQEEGESKSKPEVTRPEGGEVKWWSNVIEIQPTGPRDARYNWVGVNGRSAVFNEKPKCLHSDGTSWLLRNDEVNPRQAVWSPSGLSDLGG
jgi:general transcription factor 3C protein 4